MTVYKHLRKGPSQRKQHAIHGKQRVLEPDQPYLLQHLNVGCRVEKVLRQKIRAQGSAQCVSSVQRFVTKWRRTEPPTAGPEDDRRSGPIPRHWR